METEYSSKSKDINYVDPATGAPGSNEATGISGSRYYNPDTGQVQSNDPTDPNYRTSVGMIDTGSAVKTVNNQKNYLDTTYPQTGPAPLPTPADGSATGSSTPTTAAGSPSPAGKAYFTNSAGQEAEYTQDQLNDPATQQFLKNNGYILTKADGFNVNPDFTIGSKQTAYDTAANDVETLSKNLASYNVDNDPAYQRQAADIKANFDKLIAATKQTNDERSKALNTMGLREGTTRYANKIQFGLTGEELKQADARLSDLNTQETAALTAARTAYQNNEFAEFNAKINALKDIRSQKEKELTSYNKIITDAAKQVKDDQEQSTKTSENLIKLAESGVELTDAQLASYDKNFGAKGMAKSIFEGAKQKQKNADDLKFAQDLGKLPPGATVTRDGNTYTSTQVGKLTRVTEKAKDGTFTTVFYNADGSIASSSVGTAGSADTGTNPTGKKPTTESSPTTFVEKTAIPEMNKAIINQVGPEGFISKEDWATLMKQWEAAGGLRNTFITKFKSYTNPGPGYDYLGLPKKQ